MATPQCPKARQHFELVPQFRAADDNGALPKNAFKCGFCKIVFKSINETQMRIHLSDRTTVKEKKSQIKLCGSVPPNVSKEYY